MKIIWDGGYWNGWYKVLNMLNATCGWMDTPSIHGTCPPIHSKSTSYVFFDFCLSDKKIHVIFVFYFSYCLSFLFFLPSLFTHHPWIFFILWDKSQHQEGTYMIVPQCLSHSRAFWTHPARASFTLQVDSRPRDGWQDPPVTPTIHGMCPTHLWLCATHALLCLTPTSSGSNGVPMPTPSALAVLRFSLIGFVPQQYIPPTFYRLQSYP